MVTRRQLGIWVIIVMAVLAGCNAPQDAAVEDLEPTSTLLPIVSQTPRFTATPVPTRTPLPTFTFTPTETSPPPTATLSPEPTLTPTIVGIVQSIQRVNVRDGPGVTFNAFESVAPGTGVTIIGQNAAGDWFNIRLEDGSEGWVAARLLFIEDTPTPFPTSTPAPDLTALFLGTPLPTAIFGGGTITPTPPSALRTPDDDDATDDAPTAIPSATEPLVPIVDLDPINATATALAVGISTPTPVPSATEQTFSTPTLSVTTGGTSPSATPRPTTSGDGTVVSRDGIDVFAFCNNRAYGISAPSNIGAGSTVDIFWAWFARTRAQVQDHIDSATHELRVNGDLIGNINAYRENIIPQGADQAVYWYVPYGPVEPGTYEIVYRVSWTEAISDGYAFFGPGTGIPFSEESCTFTVR